MVEQSEAIPIQIADRVAACAMVLGYLTEGIYGSALILKFAPAAPLIAHESIELIAQIWFCLGIYSSRRWAFVVVWLFSGQRLIDTFIVGGPTGMNGTLYTIFTALAFLYCGYRLFARFGPKIIGLLPVRDDSLYSD